MTTEYETVARAVQALGERLFSKLREGLANGTYTPGEEQVIKKRATDFRYDEQGRPQYGFIHEPRTRKNWTVPLEQVVRDIKAADEYKALAGTRAEESVELFVRFATWHALNDVGKELEEVINPRVVGYLEDLFERPVSKSGWANARFLVVDAPLRVKVGETEIALRPVRPTDVEEEVPASIGVGREWEPFPTVVIEFTCRDSAPESPGKELLHVFTFLRLFRTVSLHPTLFKVTTQGVRGASGALHFATQRPMAPVLWARLTADDRPKLQEFAEAVFTRIPAFLYAGGEGPTPNSERGQRRRVC